jgi:hypothetical protein
MWTVPKAIEANSLADDTHHENPPRFIATYCC